MSSSPFGAILPADPLGRHIVRLTGGVLLLSGILLILRLPVAGSWQLLLCVLWTSDCSWRLFCLERGYRQVRSIRLDTDGGVTVTTADGGVLPVALTSGSLVCRRFAWLRFALPGTGRHGELLFAGRSNGPGWHRFQLVWRLCSDTFGHPRRA